MLHSSGFITCYSRHSRATVKLEWSLNTGSATLHYWPECFLHCATAKKLSSAVADSATELAPTVQNFGLQQGTAQTGVQQEREGQRRSQGYQQQCLRLAWITRGTMCSVWRTWEVIVTTDGWMWSLVGSDTMRRSMWSSLVGMCRYVKWET